MKSEENYVSLNKNEKEEKQESKEWSKNLKMVYILCVMVAVFTLEIFIRGPLTKMSDSIQESLNFPYKCQLGDIFVWFKYKGKAVIFLFLFNITNIYTSLSLIALDSFGIFITGTIKLIYQDPRPFWRNDKLVPCTCATNYGSPSTTGLDIYLVCIVVYRGLINKSKSKWWKFMVWCFLLVPQILAWASRFMQNLHSLHQLTFGVFCGYIIQYIYFEIVGIDLDSEEQLGRLVNTPWIMFTLAISTLSWFLFNALHYYYIHITEPQFILDNIAKYCSLDIPFYLFDNESYQKTAKAFLFMGSIVGIYLEYSIVFENNYSKYSAYNMGNRRWNSTDNYKTILRMLVMYLLAKVILFPTKWGDTMSKDIFYLNFTKCIFTNFCKGIFYFCIIKFFFRFLTLTNESTGATGDYICISGSEDEERGNIAVNNKNHEQDQPLINQEEN